jgi:tetrahydromethanopterin S-methyltransferase subunit D
MLHDDDLEAAVGAGVVTQAQADALRTFSRQRQKVGVAERADEERFRFMRGFNDFFFAIGVVLFGGGIAMYASIRPSPIVYGLAAVSMWGLAELLVRRMRLVLPGIVIVLFFVIFVVLALSFVNLLTIPSPFLPSGTSGRSWSTPTFGHSGAPQVAIKAVIAGLAAAGFYARFRFPFALLLIAGSVVAAFELAASHFLFEDSAVANLLLLFLCGVAVFSVAMRFDLSDRLRATRRSDCAFWLHVLAAPLLVHSLVDLVSDNTFKPDTFAAIMIVVIALLLTIVALIIDRRALLVSALVYVGSAIAFALSNAAIDRSFILIATLVILGALVLALGVGWAPLRRRVVSVLPSNVVDRLPPVVPA